MMIAHCIGTKVNSKLFTYYQKFYATIDTKQGHALNNLVEGVSDEAFYPWESPKKIQLKSIEPTFVT